MFSLKFEALFGKNDLFIYSATRSMTRCHFSKSRTNFISNASGLMKFMIIKTGFSQSPIAIVHFQPDLGSLHTHLVDSKRMQMWCLMCSLTGQIQSLAQKKSFQRPLFKVHPTQEDALVLQWVSAKISCLPWPHDHFKILIDVEKIIPKYYVLLPCIPQQHEVVCV